MDHQSAMIAEKVSDSILASALAEERKIDAQLKKMENLGKHSCLFYVVVIPNFIHSWKPILSLLKI